jgi:hypothetical protein
MHQDLWGSHTQTCVESLAHTRDELRAKVKYKLEGVHDDVTADL